MPAGSIPHSGPIELFLVLWKFSLMGLCLVGLIPHGGPIELFLVPLSLRSWVYVCRIDAHGGPIELFLVLWKSVCSWVYGL